MGEHISPALSREAQLLLRWAESLEVTLVPQFIMGSQNVIADSLSCQDQIIGSEWTLSQDVVDELGRKWPVVVDLLATFLNYRLPMYFFHLKDPMVVGTDAFLQSWDVLQAYAFPPFAVIHSVLNKLWSSRGTLVTLMAPLWPQEWFPEPQSLAVAPPVSLPLRADLLRQPHVHCLHQNLHVLQLHAWRL